MNIMEEYPPLYYRFLYSPSSGEVTLSHNEESLPANIPTFNEMEQERPEKDLQRGFAFRYPWGYEVYDPDMQDVDPHVREQVMASIDRIGEK